MNSKKDNQIIKQDIGSWADCRLSYITDSDFSGSGGPSVPRLLRHPAEPGSAAMLEQGSTQDQICRLDQRASGQSHLSSGNGCPRRLADFARPAGSRGDGLTLVSSLLNPIALAQLVLRKDQSRN